MRGDRTPRLLLATPTDEDPVLLLQSAGRAHIPINPSAKGSSSAFADPIMAIVPEPQNRPTIDAVIGEIMDQSWYKQQIVDRRTVDAKPGQIGTYALTLSVSNIYLGLLWFHSLVCVSGIGHTALGEHQEGAVRLQEDHIAVHAPGRRYQRARSGKACYRLHEHRVWEKRHIPGK